MVTFWLYSVSKYSKRCSPEAYTASFMLLSSSVNARLPLCTWVEKAWLRNPCWGVWGQLLLIYQQWHYQQCLVKREPVIQNSGATLAVKAGFKLHFPWLPWRLGSDYEERVSEQCCHTSGYYHSGLRSDHQRITGSWSNDFFFFFVLNEMLCSVMAAL